VIVLVLAITTTATTPARLDVLPIAKNEIDRRLEAATVSLVSLACDLGLDTGTGVAVAGDRVLTNRHVAERFRSLQLVYDGTAPRMMTPALIGADQSNDVAVLRPGPLGLTPLVLARADPRPGEPVWVSGYAHERGPDSLSDGLVVAPAHVVAYQSGRDAGQRDKVMRVDVPVRPGMSGGAVLDQAGHLAGVVFAQQSATNSGLVIPASVLRTELGQQLPRPTTC
jgi:S1-C subfamily serine protease